MARPKKERELVYKHHLHLRLTETEYEVAAENARLAKLTMSEYVRRLLAKKKVVIKYELVASVPELKKLTAEFGRIASNINQITRQFNQGGPISPELQKKAMQRLRRPVFEEEKAEELYGEILTAARAPKKDGKGYGYPVMGHMAGLDGRIQGDRRKLLAMAGY